MLSVATIFVWNFPGCTQYLLNTNEHNTTQHITLHYTTLYYTTLHFTTIQYNIYLIQYIYSGLHATPMWYDLDKN
jgi:hypothetical protein